MLADHVRAPTLRVETASGSGDERPDNQDGDDYRPRRPQGLPPEHPAGSPDPGSRGEEVKPGSAAAPEDPAKDAADEHDGDEGGMHGPSVT